MGMFLVAFKILFNVSLSILDTSQWFLERKVKLSFLTAFLSICNRTSASQLQTTAHFRSRQFLGGTPKKRSRILQRRF